MSINRLSASGLVVGVASLLSALLLMSGFWVLLYYALWVDLGAAILAVLVGLAVGSSRWLRGMRALAVANVAVILGIALYMGAANASDASSAGKAIFVLSASLPAAGCAVLVGWLLRFAALAWMGTKP